MQDDSQELITVRSRDGEAFTRSRDFWKASSTLTGILQDTDETTLDLPETNKAVLALVVSYLENYMKNGVENKPFLDEFSTELKKKPNGKDMQVFAVILAANFLDIKSLHEFACKTVAGMMAGKTAEENRQQFNIKNDFTPEEEAQVRRENEWCQKEKEKEK
jgi:S-phase kinase-associated protein 1